MYKNDSMKHVQWELLFSRFGASIDSTAPNEKEYIFQIVDKIPESLLSDAKTVQEYRKRIKYLRNNYLKKKYNSEYPKDTRKRTKKVIDLKAAQILERSPLETTPFTQAEISKLLGISNVAVSKKENTEKTINRIDLCCFSLIYNVTPHYLLGLVSENDFDTYLVSASAYDEYFESLFNTNRSQNGDPKPPESSDTDKPQNDDPKPPESSKEFNLLEFPVFVADDTARRLCYPMSFTESFIEYQCRALIFIMWQNSVLFQAIFSIMDGKIEEIRKNLSYILELLYVEKLDTQKRWQWFLSEKFHSYVDFLFSNQEFGSWWKLFRFKERLTLLAFRDYESWENLCRIIFTLFEDNFNYWPKNLFKKF